MTKHTTDSPQLPSEHHPLRAFLATTQIQSMVDFQPESNQALHLRVYLKSSDRHYRFTGKGVLPASEEQLYRLARDLRHNDQSPVQSGEVLLALVGTHNQAPYPFATVPREALEGTALEDLEVDPASRELFTHRLSSTSNLFAFHTAQSHLGHLQKWSQVDRDLFPLLQEVKGKPVGAHLKVSHVDGTDTGLVLVFPDSEAVVAAFKQHGFYRIVPKFRLASHEKMARDSMQGLNWLEFFNLWMRNTTLHDPHGDMELCPMVPDSGLHKAVSNTNVFHKDVPRIRVGWESLKDALLGKFAALEDADDPTETPSPLGPLPRGLPGEGRLMARLQASPVLDRLDLGVEGRSHLEMFVRQEGSDTFHTTRRVWMTGHLTESERLMLSRHQEPRGDVLVVYRRSRKPAQLWVLSTGSARLLFGMNPHSIPLPEPGDGEDVALQLHHAGKSTFSLVSQANFARRKLDHRHIEHQLWRKSQLMEDTPNLPRLVVHYQEGIGWKPTGQALLVEPLAGMESHEGLNLTTPEGVLEWLGRHSLLHHPNGDTLLEVHHPSLFIGHPKDPETRSRVRLNRLELQALLPFELPDPRTLKRS